MESVEGCMQGGMRHQQLTGLHVPVVSSSRSSHAAVVRRFLVRTTAHICRGALLRCGPTLSPTLLCHAPSLILVLSEHESCWLRRVVVSLQDRRGRRPRGCNLSCQLSTLLCNFH